MNKVVFRLGVFVSATFDKITKRNKEGSYRLGLLLCLAMKLVAFIDFVALIGWTNAMLA